MKSLSADEFRRAVDEGATVVDTRTPAAAAAAPVAGAIHLTLEEVQAGRLPDLDPDDAIVLICARGQISELVGLYLEAAGYRNVANLRGGTAALAAARHDDGDR